MPDLLIPPGPGVADGLVVPAELLAEQFSRSSGPGGQGVNTTDSRVQLSLRVVRIPGLSEAQQARLTRHLDGRLVDGVLTVDASEQRSQFRNRSAARERMAQIIREALAPPPPRRRPTRPTRGASERRLDAKRIRGQIKAGRGAVNGEIRRPGAAP